MEIASLLADDLLEAGPPYSSSFGTTDANSMELHDGHPSGELAENEIDGNARALSDRPAESHLGVRRDP